VQVAGCGRARVRSCSAGPGRAGDLATIETGTVTIGRGCAEIRSALGVYVVGAIDPADRAVVEAHLAWCVDCREELAGLAGLPGRLGSVPAADVARLAMGEPVPGGGAAGDRPDAALRALLDRAVALRRHRMWRRVAAAAAVMVVAAGGAVAVSRAVAPPSALSAASPVLAWATTVHGSNLHTGAAATVRYAAQPWGLQVQAQVSGIPPGTRCELLVLGAGGPMTAGGWTVAPGHAAAWYPLSAPSAGSGVRGFVVTTTSGKPLVSVPIR
jgi:Putative zinc-finger